MNGMEEDNPAQQGGVSVLIRLAVESDLSWLLDMYAALDLVPEPRLDADTAIERFRRMCSYPDYRVYVCEQAGVAVGTFSLLLVDGLAHGGRPHGIVEDVVVTQGLRGCGLGRTMMQFAMARCAEAGCYKMGLSSHLRREDAHRFYEGLGFDRHGYSYLIAC
jgi:GNAT superfamily N-acetyltransferase